MDADEAIYARVFHESLVRGDFASFTMLGQPWFEKPPLFFWLARLSVAAFGETAFALRLVSALSIVACVALVVAIVRRLTKDDAAALVAGATLLFTGLFVFAGRQVRMDVPVTALILLAFYVFLSGQERPRRLAWFGPVVAAGVLCKSVIGLLAYPAILIFSLLRGDWRWLKSKWFWGGHAIGALLVLPWHAYQTARFGRAFWDSYLFAQVLARVNQAVVYGREAPITYHLKQLFVLANPWLFAFLAALAWACVVARKEWRAYRDEIASGMLALFFFLLFFLPRTRLLYYFVPALPFTAIFLALVWRRWRMRAPRAAVVVLYACLALGALGTSLRIFDQRDRDLFLRPLSVPSRYMIAEDEKIAGLEFGRAGLPLYAYNWLFYPTMLYYSDGNRLGLPFERARAGDRLEPPYLLLIPTPLFRGLDALPVLSASNAEAVFLHRGPAGTLLRVGY